MNADPEQLQRAFGHLVLNAIQAMLEGGTLGIVCHTASKSIADIVSLEGSAKPSMLEHKPQITDVEVTIRDTGVGIAADQIDGLLTPFFTTNRRGMGLGLALTYRILEDHGGSIQIASELGTGTVVTVRLPGATTVTSRSPETTS
ncbi:hypothetical protein C2W62_48350 [Candidatus Entotheonella serta]|nr:hypothetical protein C2W62_48350 [Candidatus Entotheonella serta]